jgi:hypothetical protein
MKYRRAVPVVLNITRESSPDFLSSQRVARIAGRPRPAIRDSAAGVECAQWAV